MKKRSNTTSAILATLLVLTLCSIGYSHLFNFLPEASIEYQAGVFQKSAANGVLQDVEVGSGAKWLDKDTTSITQIIGSAHAGQAGQNQAGANARIVKIQIWGWLDGDGDGAATFNDAKTKYRTTKWKLLSELKPGDGLGDAVGWDIEPGAPTTAFADVLQVGVEGAHPISIGSGESWLLLIRVVDSAGNCNLFDERGGVEMWDDGDTSNFTGSDVPSHKYIDHNGNTPGTSDARIQDNDIVWIYRPR